MYAPVTITNLIGQMVTVFSSRVELESANNRHKLTLEAVEVTV